MSDFDPDAYLASKSDQRSEQAFDPDAYLSSRKSQPSKTHREDEPENTWWGAIKGDVDAAAALGSRVLVSPVAALARTANRLIPDWDNTRAQVKGNIDAIENRFSYDPRTPEGQYAINQIGKIVQPIAEGLSKATGAVVGQENVPAVADVVTAAPLLGASRVAAAASSAAKSTAGAIGDIAKAPLTAYREAVARGKPSAQELLNAQASAQSMGAAAAAPNLAAMSPELRQAVTAEAQRTGGAVNSAALARHAEADSLPVKIQLTEGQATQDPTVLSNEVNSRGVNKDIADRYNQQNDQLKQNIQAFRDRVGPDVFSANTVEHGDTLIDAYEAKDAAARAEIDSAFAEARKSISPKAPVLDARDLYGRVNAILEDRWANGPPDIMARLEKLAGSGDATISAKQFEGLRSRLAELARDGDGSTRFAANLIRGAVEDSDFMPGAESFKAPFDKARTLARARFQALEADPAYNAAVNRTVAPDQFVQKYVINGSRDNVARMRENFADNAVAQQTMGVAAIDHLRRAAGIDDLGNGNFSQARYNKAFQSLSPKMRSLVDADTADQMETLGNVARYTQAQPRGSFVNNSNTFVAQAGQHAANILEGAANIHTGIPIATLVRKAAANRAQAKATREALKPGAGLGRLSDLPQ